MLGETAYTYGRWHAYPVAAVNVNNPALLTVPTFRVLVMAGCIECGYIPHCYQSC